ncbi:ABC transporter ATP-binding protein [Neptuniibacter halophilus]|uniref:ABC transporter ATP-binding protein n=1 Tax=Neptuniibacter halophilus TaxID=651666 RepID=UPI0025733C29|nr:ABC transporter ATP-binding protein [Neptuniibacter halophilus]
MLKWLSRTVTHDNPAQLEQAFRWLYSFVRPQKKSILGLLLLSMCASLLVLLQPWLTKMLIDDGLLAKDYSALVTIAIGMIFVGIFSTALSGVNRYLHTGLSGRILFALRNDLYQHLQGLSPLFYGRQRIGDLISRLDGDVAQIQRFAVDSLFSAVSSILGLVGAAVMMLLLSWKLSLLVLIMIPLEVLWLRWMRQKVEVQTRRLRERSADISSFLVETLPAMKFIQSVGQEPRERKRLEGLNQEYLGDLLKLQVTEFFTQAIPNTLTSMTRASAFLIGGYWVIEGQWQLGSLIAFSTYLGMAVGPVNSLLGLYVAVQRMSVSLGRVNELRLHQPDVSASASLQADLPAGFGELRISGLDFAYPGRQEKVFDQAELYIPGGSKVALSGTSGVGKSTLVDLIHRHFEPAGGEILLDGQPVNSIAPALLRTQVAVVSQDIVLFRASLKENIRYAAPSASDDEVEQAARAAQLNGLIEHLPQGLDSELGERGQQLSGGQRQRIAIARAILQKPRLLILDEATAAVDEQTEAEVIAAVDHLFSQQTRILISHRASTLLGVDQHYQVEGGKLKPVAVSELTVE